MNMINQVFLNTYRQSLNQRLYMVTISEFIKDGTGFRQNGKTDRMFFTSRESAAKFAQNHVFYSDYRQVVTRIHRL